MRRTPIENCLLRASLKRLGMILQFRPMGMVNEQFGIAAVATELGHKGLVGTRLQIELDQNRTVARNILEEVAKGKSYA